jgi:4-hydroxybenzoyl-CoA thioesterase
MFVNKRDVQIQWGDCDPANIVYYPRYFAMFDDSTSIMFEAAGFSKQDIIHKYGLVGIPMVDTRAKFHIPSFETRVLVGRHPDDPARLKSAPMPPEIIERFMRG